jgi:hypothetical protein
MDKQNIIWFAISILVLAVLATFWIRQRVRLKHARSWPAEAGRVESTAIRLQQSSGGQLGTTSSTYIATLTYSYAVQGQYYSGVLRRNFMLQSRAEKWTGRYVSGLPLTVRYNPAHPKDSVLFEDEQVGMAA